MADSGSIRFFDAQFRRQAAAGEFGLNPFEARALPYLSGSVLDLGCGLGNLAVAAAGQGARVLALDASPAAIESLAARAGTLPIEARVAELIDYIPEGRFDTVVAIGLFMFFPCPAARRQLARALAAVKPGGVLVVNVLIEGTTYMDMFDPQAGYCLFAEDELPRALAGWQMLDDRVETFPAPSGVKRFRTTIARREGKILPQ